MLAHLLPRNIGRTDRVLRVVLGLALLSLTMIGPRTAWGYLGLILVVTGVAGTCPLYSLLHVSTDARAT